jgi:hypothetical protein
MRPWLGLVLALAVAAHAACLRDSRRAALSASLTDQQFWDLTSTFSEPAGVFTHSDNLVSNEIHFVHTLRMLRPAGGVYVGVGPEQNFSYIARLRPALAFVVDIRRENRNLHLMYKALVELSSDRADFLSRLFSRPRPPSLGAHSSVRDLFAEYHTARASEQIYQTNARLIRERLLEAHGLPLTAEDLEWIDYALRAFYTDGPDIHYARSRPKDPPGPSYRFLMTANDVQGESRSYLATEDNFAFVKELQAGNRIVPVVGDFAGADALRRVGGYIHQREAVVSAFYGSNVEVYLTRAKMTAYCANLARLPYSSRTWFIDSKGVQPLRAKLRSCSGG